MYAPMRTRVRLSARRISLLASVLVLAGWLGAGGPAAALAAESPGGSAHGASIDPGLGVSGLIVLSCGIALLGLGRAAPRSITPAAQTSPLRPGGTAAGPGTRSRGAAAAGAPGETPLLPVVSALLAVAGALEVIAGELPEPAAAAVRRESARVSEAGTALRRWLRTW